MPYQQILFSYTPLNITSKEKLCIIHTYISFISIFLYIYNISFIFSLLGRETNFFETYTFGFRNLFYAHPFRLMIWQCIASWMCCAFAIHCAEREKNVEFTLETSLWFTVVTMTTCGYGDYYPTHDGARLVAMLSAFNGLALAAICTGMVGNSLDFSEHEESAVIFSQKRELQDKLENAAAVRRKTL